MPKHFFIKYRQVLIFGLVGGANTLVDLTVYLTLLHATHSIIIANITATTAALVVSYLLNRRYTFKSQTLSVKQLGLFLFFTLTGLWILQTAVIYIVTPAAQSLSPAMLSWLGPLTAVVIMLIPKLIGTAVTLVWNYIWYSRVVFKDAV